MANACKFSNGDKVMIRCDAPVKEAFRGTVGKIVSTSHLPDGRTIYQVAVKMSEIGCPEEYLEPFERYRVGDFVLIRKDADSNIQLGFVDYDMGQYLGAVAEIRAVASDYTYTLDIDDATWLWHHSWLGLAYNISLDLDPASLPDLSELL